MIIFWLIALAIALSVHEYAHARVADELGDPTPRLMGRLTLNPLAHIDPIGTLALFIFHFGWGKPVRIDPYNLSSPKRDEALISLAGPASNFITAAVFSLTYRLLLPFAPWSLQSFLTALIQATVIINLGLGIFNLIPLYPLDGSKILLGLLPDELGNELEQVFKTYGILILLAFFFLPLPGGGSLVGAVLEPILSFSLKIFLGI